MKRAGIIGAGKYLPKKVVTNDDFVKMGLDTSDTWIRERTGIIERRIAEDGESSSDMAYEAAFSAISNAKINPEEIDLIIVATSTPDHLCFPSTACLLQKKLGLKHIAAFDLSAACTGFAYALTVGTQFIQTGFAQKILVVGSDCLTKFVDWQDRGTCILFGDGAGAVILGEAKEGYGILNSKIKANGADADALIVPAGGSKKVISQQVLENRENFIKMNGKAVYKLAVNYIVPTIQESLQEVGLESKDINYFIPHQANLRIIDYASQKLGLKPEQVFINLDKYGNTSAASIPIALAEGINENKFKDGDIIVLAGFGAGFTWGVNILKYERKADV